MGVPLHPDISRAYLYRADCPLFPSAGEAGQDRWAIFATRAGLGTGVHYLSDGDREDDLSTIDGIKVVSDKFSERSASDNTIAMPASGERCGSRITLRGIGAYDNVVAIV